MRSFSRPAKGLQRDHLGHRTGFKVLIRVRQPMELSSFKRWGIKQRIHIAKSKFVWRYYSSSTAMGLHNGIPISVMRNNKTMAEYIIRTFYLSDGDTYSIQGWTNARTKTHMKFTPTLAIIRVFDSEKLKYQITKCGRLDRYWFRKEKVNPYAPKW